MALPMFEQALKTLRKETGKRKAIFEGIGGHLYVLALIKSGDPKHDKLADAYLDIATRAVQSHDTAVYQQLSMLRQIRGGTVDPDGAAVAELGSGDAAVHVPRADALLAGAAATGGQARSSSNR